MSKSTILIRSKKKRASKALEAGDLEEAGRLLEQLRSIQHHDPDFWGMLGTLKLREGRYEDAVGCLRNAAELRPAHAQTQYYLGIALRHSNKLEAAAKAFREACNLEPDYPDPYEELANVLMRLGDIEAAENALQTALRLHPDKAELHANLGTLMQVCNRFEEAAACYRQAQHIRPMIAHENLGGVYCAQGKLDKAINCLRDGLKIPASQC